MTKTVKRWVVFRAYEFSTLSVGGINLMSPDEGPHWFLPVFKTKKDAIAFNCGSSHYIKSVTCEVECK